MSVEPQDRRPDPDALLAQVQAQEAREKRGKLKIFFGAAAGVGKTYAMLSSARARAVEGDDVVIGYAEPHARPDTEQLLLGLELLPFLFVDYRNTRLKEFDLDGALKRKPELIVVDELAHTNAPGMRHAKRWQDVEELLGAGIDVHTTLNVQHIESLNDVVAQITGIVVNETLPDAVFERADEVELVDLPPEELLERLREGKVYVSEQAERATQYFFRKPNLIALRELALRKTAERVSRQVQTARSEQSSPQTWPTAERILVCVSPSPGAGRVVRSAKRLAVALGAPWIAVHVETSRLRSLSQRDKERLQRNFHLAERLGAETVTLNGLNAADEIISFARQRNVTKIVVGRNDGSRWRDLIFDPTVNQLLRKSAEIDVYVIRGGPDDDVQPRRPGSFAPQPGAWQRFLKALVIVFACTLVNFAMFWAFGLHERDLSNLIMVYLFGVAVVAARYGRAPAVAMAVLSVLLFDVIFVPPRFHIAVSDSQYLITFAVMLAIAVLIGTLTARLREQADASRRREEATRALFRMSQDLAATTGLTALAQTIVNQVADVFHVQSSLLLPEEGKLSVRASSTGAPAQGEAEIAVAQWVLDHREPAGRGTDTLPSAAYLYLPLISSQSVIGILGLCGDQVPQLLIPEHRPLLDAFAARAALALERDRLAHQARQAQVQAEAEKLRSTLLASVSHDLRTPLAVITGASDALRGHPEIKSAQQKEWLETISDESHRLSRLVNNLLDMTRLESGTQVVNRQWHPLEEIIGSALNRLEGHIGHRTIKTTAPPDLPLVPVDGVLLEQVFINLIENALKYTPDGTGIEIAAAAADDAQSVTVEIADHGRGLEAGEDTQVFEKFYRGPQSGARRGIGLGLPICRAIIESHGGRIWAENRPPPDHGAIFRFTLPIVGTPPRIDPETTSQ